MTFLNKNLTKKHNKAFTLIELLVVISIIALLSSVVLASLKNARQKAYETKVIQTVHEMQNAVELFRSEYGHYPYGYFNGSLSGSNFVYASDFNKDTNQANINKFMNFSDSLKSIISSGIQVSYRNPEFEKNTNILGWSDENGNVVTEGPFESTLCGTDLSAQGDGYVIVISYPNDSYLEFNKMPVAYSGTNEGAFESESLGTYNVCVSSK